MDGSRGEITLQSVVFSCLKTHVTDPHLARYPGGSKGSWWRVGYGLKNPFSRVSDRFGTVMHPSAPFLSLPKLQMAFKQKVAFGSMVTHTRQVYSPIKFEYNLNRH